MVEVKIDGIRNDKDSNSPVVVLEEIASESKRKLAIWIGESEAWAIHTGLEEKSLPRPMTHDLIKNIVNALSAQITTICINACEGSTFYAKLKLKSNSQEIDIDSRPSDALAIAIRYNAPIYVEENLIEKHGFFEKEKKDG